MCSLGTYGDIRPFISIGRQLVAAGYRVDLLANEQWSELSRKSGFNFVPIAPADPPQNGRDDFRFFKDNVFPSFERTFSHLSSLVEGGENPIVVYRNNMLGAACACEVFKLRSAKVLLQPSSVPSNLRPPWPLTPFCDGALAPVGKVVVPTLLTAGRIVSPYRKYANQFRQSVGLPKVNRWRREEGVEQVSLLLCPRWFAIPADDWPANLYMTGFPLEPPQLPDTELREIDPAIIMVSGTGVDDHVQLLDRSHYLSERFERPVIALSAAFPEVWTRHGQVITKSFADLSAILPRAVALVHHGGIGTTSEAVRAGVPQLIIADRFDQPDNGARIAQLGLGGAILRDQPSLQQVGDTLEAVLNSQFVSEQLATAAALVSFDNGIAGAVGHLLGLAEDRQIPCSLSESGSSTQTRWPHTDGLPSTREG